MNYDLAARELIERAQLPLPVRDPEGLSLAHASWMLTQVRSNSEWSDSKKGRWLGWAQAVLCQHKVFDLVEMKALNEVCSCDDEGCPLYEHPHLHMIRK